MFRINVKPVRINLYNLIFSSFFVFGLVHLSQSQPIKCVDADGNEYKTVKIGHQIWMAENLRTTTYSSGIKIKNMTGNYIDLNNRWIQDGHYKIFNSKNGSVFLYDWYAVNIGLCPNGWHIPSIYDWKELSDYVGKDDDAKSYKSKSGWPVYEAGGFYTTKSCPNCYSWNLEYRSKVPCHVCKDTRSVRGDYIQPYMVNHNGTNSLGFNAKKLGLQRAFQAGMKLDELGSGAEWWTSDEILDKTESVSSYDKQTVYVKAVSIDVGVLSRLIKNPSDQFKRGYSGNYKESMLQVRCVCNFNHGENGPSSSTTPSNINSTNITPNTLAHAKANLGSDATQDGEYFILDGDKFKWNPTTNEYDWIVEQSRSSSLLLADSSRLHGEQKWYYESGQLSCKGFYEAGLKSGQWIWYFDNGQVRTIMHYSEGFKNGNTIRYFSNGKIKYSGGFNDDKKNGIWIWYHPNGEISCKGEYSDGMEIGQFTFYNEDGSLKHINKY